MGDFLAASEAGDCTDGAKRAPLLVDTHAHIDTDRFDEDRDDMLARAKAAGLAAIINMGDSMESSGRSVAMARQYDMVYTGVGIHPEEARPMTQADDDLLAGWAREAKVVAIGEIGLDYYWDKEAEVQEKQRYWFNRQMDLARETNLPIIIHSRDAAEDTMKVMKDAKAHELKGVVHCYSYSKEIAQEFIKMGYYIGVGGVVTFKNARKLVETVEAIPLDRILLETDCPYMAPEPNRGKRNDSSNIQYVIKKIAEIKGISEEEVEKVTEHNAYTLFKKIKNNDINL